MKKMLVTVLMIALAIFVLCLVSNSASADTHTVIATGNAADGTTWDTGTAPDAGDDLVITGAYDLSMNQAITYGDIAVNAYSGTVTQVEDFGYEDLTINSGTWKAINSKFQTCSGNITKTGTATITGGVWKLHITGSSVAFSCGTLQLHTLWVSGSVLISGETYARNNLTVDEGAVVTLTSGQKLICHASSPLVNAGLITGQSTTSRFLIYADSSKTISFGNIACELMVYGQFVTVDKTITCGSDIKKPSRLIIQSGHATAKTILDTSGYDIETAIVLFNDRGVLVNTGASESTVICDTFDASKTTALFNGTNFRLMMTQAGVLKMTATEHLDQLHVSGGSFALTVDVNISEAFVFTGLVAAHPYGWYENGTRVSTISTDANGTYSLGSGVFAWDNATLKITPVITIDPWEHTDTFRNTVWQGYDYWADHDCDLLVTWSMTASEDWLTIDDTGNITGTPDEDGTCYYTITVTYSNGETATVSGYVDVVTSATQSASMTVSALLGALVLVLIVSSVMVMFNRSQRS